MTAANEQRSATKDLLKRLLEKSPFRIIRARTRNRFFAQQETLTLLARRGYRPRRIVDGGAHVGDFARMARSVFADAVIDLIEPQAACQAALRGLVGRMPGCLLHPVAIGRTPGTLTMACDPSAPSTGAHIQPGKGKHSGALEPVAVSTLDSILSGIGRDDRVLLKLDLQGWELEALQGAMVALASIEMILIEVSFYAQAYEPPIATLIAFLSDHGFVLHDIATLVGRQRDDRAHQADFLFVRAGSALDADRSWD